MSSAALKVLLVDDDEDDYLLTREMLAEIDGGAFELSWVSTYAAGRAAIERAAHDVYLLDYSLGEQNGLDLLREACARPSWHGAPLILLTGQSDHSIDFEAMKAGASDYLVKGQIGPALLARSIRYSCEQARNLRALRESEERYHGLVEMSPDAIILHTDGRIVFANSAALRLLGAERPEQLLGSPVINIVHEDYRATVRERIRQVTTEGAGVPFIEEKIVRLDGEVIDAEVGAVPLNYRGHVTVQVVARDISVRKRAERKLIHDAFHDPLTGLPNRALFTEHLNRAVEQAKRGGSHQYAVLFLDLDRFKNINDGLGHTIGDQLLVGIARRLERCLRDCDIVARFGGDEFVVLLDGTDEKDSAVRVAERLQKELEQPFCLGGFEVFTSASIGIAHSNADYSRPEEVVRDADTAMYRAKALGKARHEVFDREMHARAVALLQLETDLRRAFERGEFRVYYQPIISLTTDRIYGLEALVRWQHPEHGLIAPAQFIPLAEETGLIIPLDLWVMREACRQVGEWQRLAPAGRSLTLSVNLSGKQFTQPNLVEQVKGILLETNFDRRQLHLEITESAVIQHVAAAAATLERIRELGIRLSMDDFGTGYSSLSCLHRFPIHTLKIDRSFIGSGGLGDEHEIVRTIIMLAKNLGMEVVAEGVETAAQLEHLRGLACDFAQGYYFSPPTEATAVETFLKTEAYTLV